ncbi:MAG: molybdopterin-dependent oxidoreductase [Polyangiaceae bacterium]
MTRVATYCRICEAACGLLAEHGPDGVSLSPDPDHVVSRGFACAKGVRFGQVHRDSARVNQPMLRKHGSLQCVSWSEAYQHVGGELKRIREAHGPHAIGVYLGNPAAFSPLTTLFGTAFVRGLGTRNYFNAGSLDCNNKFVVAREMLGSPGTHPIPDLDHSRFALLLGTNPSVSQSSFVNAPRMVERLRNIEKRGGRVIVVDPRRTETARSVGEWLPIRPGGDAALLLGLVHVILRDGLQHNIRVGRFTHGLEDLRRHAAPFDPQRVSGLTGIAPERVESLAREFAAADGAFCHVSTGVNQGPFGSLAYAAKIALEAITGNLDRRGGALFPRGALDVAAWARRLGIDREPKWKSRIGGFSPVLGALPCAILPDEILTPGPEKLRALVVLAGNPLLSAADGGRLLKAFQSLELLVVIDLFVNDTGALAHAVLPATDWLEREDIPLAQLQLQPEPYLQWTPAVAEVRGERRHDWQILMQLARSSGTFVGSAAGHRALAASLKLLGPSGLMAAPLAASLGVRPLGRLKRHPHGLRLPESRPGEFLERRIGTPSRRVELCPEAVFADASKALRGAPRGPELLLFSKRQRVGHNSWMHNNPELRPEPQRAHLAPQDAQRLGLKNGDWVRLVSEAGRIELPVALDPDVAPGGISVPHGYGHHEASGWHLARERGGANVNQLASSGPDATHRLSGMSQFNAIPVRVEKLVRLSVANAGDAAGA